MRVDVSHSRGSGARIHTTTVKRTAHPPQGSAPPVSTLRVLGVLVTGFATVLTPFIYYATGRGVDALSPAIISVAGMLFLICLHLGLVRLLPMMLVGAVMVSATVGAITFGSVRTTGSFLFVAAVVCAGIFMRRAALVITVGVSLALIAALILAETQGWIHPRSYAVGPYAWLSYAATLIAVAIMVYHSQSTGQRALRQAQEELELRRRSEVERQRNQERFARIFRNSPSPMVAQSGSTGVILDVNPAFERCFGYTREQVLGRRDAFLWAHQHQRRGYLRRLLARRALHQEHCEGLRRDGSTFHGLLSSEMGRDADDMLVISTIADVSDQAEALQRLRSSEERFAKAFNLSPLNMAITRLSDGSLIEVNHAQDGDTSGYRDSTLMSDAAWVLPQDRDAFKELLRRDGRVHGFETRLRNRNGQIVDVRLWAAVIDIDSVECVLSCAINISEEKRREAQLIELAKGMTGETGEQRLSNLCAHLARSLGADKTAVAELRAGGIVRVLAADVDGVSIAPYAFAIKGTPCEQVVAQREPCLFRNEVDTLFPEDITLAQGGFKAYLGQALLDDDGHTIGVIQALWRHPVHPSAEELALTTIFANRTNAELLRLKREREIHRLNVTLEHRVRLRTAELERLNAELDSFAYSVSHDLKSPLRAIDGFTRLLAEKLEGRMDAEEEQLFSRVLGSTQRMGTLIADLLALARVSQGRLALESTDLSAMAEQILQAEQTKDPKRTLRWEIEPGLVSLCDPKLARVALENLLGNAVKYTRNQPQPLIEVRRRPREASEPDTFVVRDNGVGFDMAYADKLFKPFQRLHMPSDFEGTGIGLATVRRIVERHGGRIEGRAAPGMGAEFRFSFAARKTTKE